MANRMTNTTHTTNTTNTTTNTTNTTSTTNTTNTLVSIRQLGSKLVKKAVSWSLLYTWGFLGLSPGWLLAPLILTVLRFTLDGPYSPKRCKHVTSPKWSNQFLVIVEWAVVIRNWFSESS